MVGLKQRAKRPSTDVMYVGIIDATPKKVQRASRVRRKVYQPGLERVAWESDFYGFSKEMKAGYIGAYEFQVGTIVGILRGMGIKPEEQERFFTEIWGIIYGNLKITYEPQMAIVDALESNTWDCDTLSYLVYDVGVQLGIKGLSLVTGPRHMFIKTRDYYFEATDTTRLYYSTIARMKKYYPKRYAVYSGKKVRAKNHLFIGFLHLMANEYQEALAHMKKANKIFPTCH